MKITGLHIVLATTLFAFLLWFSVSMSEHFQIQVSAPLEVENLPGGKALSNPLPRAVKLKFNEPGWRLTRFMWGSELKWTIDFNAIAHHHALTLRDFGDQLGSRLGVLPISMIPESLHIDLDAKDSKRVPVRARCSLDFRESYGQVGEPVVVPESITVTGARSLLARIQAWETTELVFSDVRQPINTEIQLVDTTNILSFSPASVKLHIEVQQFAEKSFDGIPIEVLSVPQNREIILNVPRIDIVVRGTIDQLAGINVKDFRAVVDYRIILSDTTGIIQPTIVSPGEMQIVRRTPEQLRYVVRKNL